MLDQTISQVDSPFEEDDSFNIEIDGNLEPTPSMESAAGNATGPNCKKCGGRTIITTSGYIWCQSQSCGYKE